jgi:hypothetical protein
VRVFIEVSARTCMSIYACTVFQKKECEVFFIVTSFTQTVCHVLYKSREMRSKEVVLTRCNFFEF